MAHVAQDMRTAFNGSALRHTLVSGGHKIRFSDLGIYPLLLAIPFMYMPRVIDGDTQPWIVSATFVAFITFRTHKFVLERDFPLIALSFLCVVVYALRSTSDFLLMRTCYMHITFVMLWLTCRREDGELFSTTIKFTIVLWFIVGIYEFASHAAGHGLGMPELFTGRTGTGDQGIPSLTAEPSFYGSLSAVQMMYLLSENKKSNRIYVLLAAASVIVSGSLLAAIMLVFPLMKLNLRLRIAAFICILSAIFINFMVSSAGLLTRISFLQVLQSGDLADKALLDPSLNIRVGNIYFTLYRHLLDSISLSTPVQYMWEYSQFAKNGGIWWDPLTDYTIPSAGELVYGSGIFGVLLIIAIILAARAIVKTQYGKLEKTIFIIACMLNPVTIANPFLIIYAQKKIGGLPSDQDFRRIDRKPEIRAS